MSWPSVPVRDTTSRFPRRAVDAVAFAYAFAGYATAGIIVPLMLLFCGGWWLPRTVDRGSSTAVALAVPIDLALLALFGLQHSLMAREPVKRRLASVLPAALERTTFVFASCLAIVVLMVSWRPIDATIWRVDGGWVVPIAGGFWLGVAIVYIATFTIGHAELLGLRQAWRHVVDDPGGAAPCLRVRGIYSMVRHPLMTGLLLCFWCASTLTAGHLLLAAGMTTYIVIGTHFEERDLACDFAATYGAYRRRVPAFVPALRTLRPRGREVGRREVGR
jgi:protein-S-isoprenylcysteine O-methyltransferase Ste14